ncbi:MAG: hypothetical protein IKC24_00170 [Oscillospiraceae bacterium]|nr:hypothetical protein [Oscillospiraceae bacterium]
MKVIAYGCEYECASAKKTADSVFLYNENGNEIGAFRGISDMSEYTVEDGEWTKQEPIPTQLDRVEAQTTYTAMMTDTLLEV